MDPGTAAGLLVVCVLAVLHLMYSSHRRMKRLGHQSQGRWQQPQPQAMIATEAKTETEDLAQEDSEGDGLMLFDDPMFPPDPEDEE